MLCHHVFYIVSKAEDGLTHKKFTELERGRHKVAEQEIRREKSAELERGRHQVAEQKITKANICKNRNV